MLPHIYTSFGAGRQSTALALLAIRRDPRLLAVTDGRLPEVWIFADTGDEPAALYPHVEKMRAMIVASGADFEIVKHKEFPLSEHLAARAADGRRMENVPFYVASEEGPLTPIRRSCTAAFKISPIRRAVKARWGKEAAECWLGISFDEPRRLKVRAEGFYCPLYAMRWHAADCVNYIRDTGVYPDGSRITPMRSACVFCPFHSREEWAKVKAVPADWAKAVALESKLNAAREIHGHIGHLRNKPWLNKLGVPLDELDTAAAKTGQAELWDDGDCDSGHCGV